MADVLERLFFVVGSQAGEEGWVRTTVRGLVRRGFIKGFSRRYFRWVVREHGTLNVRGLGTGSSPARSLAEVFIEPRLNLIGPAPHSTPERTLAIVGPPGCGKTTLLQHVAVKFAANRRYRFKLRACTPVLLFLRDHLEALSQEQLPSLGQLVQGYFTRKKPEGKSPPEGWFETRLQAGRCLVLLDGLDDVAQVERRQAVSRWVDEQIGKYPACPFVLTARTEAYREAPLARAEVLAVQPFGSEQVRAFVERWYLANSGRPLEPAARQRAQDLLQHLAQTPQMNALAANPLLLAMAATVHHHRGSLPGTRAELYAQGCEVLLGRQVTDAQDVMRGLQALAADMMEKGIRETQDVPRELLGSGLLQERDAGRWSFAHPAFQEYLAAQRMREGTCPDWKRLVAESWWREPLRFSVAQGDATEMVQACLDAGSPAARALAVECLDEAGHVAPDVRRNAEERVAADLEADEPTCRRRAALVQLARRLRALHPIDSGRAIDLAHVTCAEYQLFLDDMRREGLYLQPDHWMEVQFARGQASAPLCGARAQDAVKFCEWLTRRGGTARYRLPRLDEARAYPGERHGLGTWCHDGTGVALACPDEARLVEFHQGLAEQQFPEDERATLALALSLALDRDRALDRDIVRDVVPGRALAHALSRAPDLAGDPHLARSLALVPGLALASDLARALDFDLAHARAFDLDLERARTRALALALDLARDLDLDRDLALDFARERLKSGALEVSVGNQMLSELMEDPRRILQLSPGDRKNARRAILLDDSMNIAAAQTMPEMRHAQRMFLLRVLEYVLEATDESGAVLDHAMGWLRKKREAPLKPALLALSGWLGLMMAREAGEAPAWEGIRIVRESNPG